MRTFSQRNKQKELNRKIDRLAKPKKRTWPIVLMLGLLALAAMFLLAYVAHIWGG